jgi:hypothetical protein
MEKHMKPNTDAGCCVVADQNTLTAGERVHVRRVLWRQDRIIVYQDTSGRYWRYENHNVTPAVINGLKPLNGGKE